MPVPAPTPALRAGTCASEAYQCPRWCGSGRYRAWDNSNTDQWQCLLIVEEYKGWTLAVPDGATKFTFEVSWGFWDGNGCGDGTANVNIDGCMNVDIVRGSEVYGPYTCDVSRLRTLRINKPYTSVCEYVVIGNPEFILPPAPTPMPTPAFYLH